MKDHVTIGSSETCDLQIHDDPYVSPMHARIDQRSDGSFVLMDLGSTNGVRISRGLTELRVALGLKIPLVTGDVLIIGRTRIPWRWS